MTATLVLPSALRELAGGRSRLELPGSTVRQLFDALATTSPMLERRLRDEQGEVRRHLHVYIGDTDIRDLAGLDTAVDADTSVYVLTAVAGG